MGEPYWCIKVFDDGQWKWLDMDDAANSATFYRNTFPCKDEAKKAAQGSVYDRTKLVKFTSREKVAAPVDYVALTNECFQAARALNAFSGLFDDKSSKQFVLAIQRYCKVIDTIVKLKAPKP